VERHEGEKFYTVGEVAAAVGVSRQTLRVWEQKGILSSRRSDGRHRLYTEEDMRQAGQIALLRRRRGWNPAAIRGLATFEPGRRAWSNLSLGQRIRAIRRSRGLTIAATAELIGTSRSFLSRIECGESQVTSQLLARLADAFTVSTTALVEQSDPAAHLVRPADRPRTVLADGVVWEELAGPGHTVEPALLIVPAGASSGGPYSRPGDTFFHLVAGELSFTFSDPDDVVRVAAGDSLMLPPPTVWSWANRASAEARAIYVEYVSPERWT
jgi:excisionase family DNA binding protein